MITTPPKKTAKKSYRQTGHSVTSRDNQRKARLPGKRVSKAGNVYLERRKNRSDTPTERKWYTTMKRYKKTPAKKPAAAKKKRSCSKKITTPAVKAVNPVLKPRIQTPTAEKVQTHKTTDATFVCDGKIKAEWGNRYKAFKKGNANPPHRIKCMSTGNTMLGTSMDWCRLRSNCKDKHCIWFTGYSNGLRYD